MEYPQNIHSVSIGSQQGRVEKGDKKILVYLSLFGFPQFPPPLRLLLLVRFVNLCWFVERATPGAQLTGRT